MNDKQLCDAWIAFQRIHNCSIDRMLRNPVLRRDFMVMVKLFANPDEGE